MVAAPHGTADKTRHGVRGAVRSLLASRAEIEAAEERQETERRGCTAVSDLVPRHRAQVSGVLRSVRLRPADQVPALEAELYDGSGSLRVVWLGRREVAGIDPGRRIRLEGLVSFASGRATVYNPRYELAPRPGE
ncbi:OB-fold nucleic acid binding domain-containing protein [Actinotalea sp. M2MS4P-6]|uniref:OB-fold nucleic acid binding domain-containing protein n=1 Tax=Actinotalea sp. M2MS4P-6 TaxID=2983762 RepID=UPI0021E4BA3B|nr:OB-fold nucleic acid binding domain-containing protein [Actinotalea sp. M2MS4P-6]MCV2396342.1 OB-fold nucleic acid binding domain-containing protein [Actinotalea sp. M2MS4P-6]